MRRTIRLSISDKLLYKAVEVILFEGGFEVCDDTSAPIVTDDPKLKDGLPVLYVGNEAVKGGIRQICRPFAESELISCAAELYSEESGKSKSGIKVDKKHNTVTFDGVRIQFTEKEIKLFLLLLQNRGNAVSDAEIVQKVFENETAQGSNIAAVYVNYVRNKLDKRLDKKVIVRVRGQGYMLR